MSAVLDPITGPVPGNSRRQQLAVAAPRLARHRIRLADGHRVGVAVAGEGIPLVVVHGLSAEGFLYAQTLSRLVRMGFRVIAVDTAGHGDTEGLPNDGQGIEKYADLLGRVLDELGLERYVLAGHSMGGRLVAELAIARPEQVISVLLIDAIVGETWDRMVTAMRAAPPLLGLLAGALMVDSAAVVPLRDPVQALKLIRLAAPTVLGHVARPWRLSGPLMSILRSSSSGDRLAELARSDIPVFAIHGTRDLVVPYRTGQDAAHQLGSTLVAVEGAGHSWLLRDPETLPAIVLELLDGELGEACTQALRRRGVRKRHPGPADAERVCYRPGARIFALTPVSQARLERGRHHRPMYEWRVDPPAVASCL